MRFTGTYLHVLDQKSRICLPLSFREELGFTEKSKDKPKGKDELTFWLRFSSDPVAHIQCMSDSEYACELNKEIVRFAEYVNPVATETMFNANCYRAQFDVQGRVTIPQELKELSGINENAYVIGAGGTIRIMSAENRKQMTELYEQEHRQALEAMQQERANKREELRASHTTQQMPYGMPPYYPQQDAQAQPYPYYYPPYPPMYPGYAPQQNGNKDDE